MKYQLFIIGKTNVNLDLFDANNDQEALAYLTGYASASNMPTSILGVSKVDENLQEKFDIKKILGFISTATELAKSIDAASDTEEAKKLKQQLSNLFASAKNSVNPNLSEDEVESTDLDDLVEDTVKNSDGKWENVGDSGESHGEFETKKEADAQRKAMFANGYHECVNESLLQDLHKDFEVAEKNWDKLGLEMSLDDALKAYNASSDAPEKVYIFDPIYKADKWEDMIRFVAKNQNQ